MKKQNIQETTPGKMMDTYNKLFPGIFKRIAEKRKEGWPSKWPAWCDTPDTIVAQTMAEYIDPAIIKKMTKTDPEKIYLDPEVRDLNFMCPTINALFTWNKTKNIYSFDSDMSNELAKTEFAGNIPAKVLLRIPDWCVFIDIINSPIEGHEGFFALPDYNAHDDQAEMFLLPIMKGAPHLCAPFRIILKDDITIEESIWRTTEEDFHKPRNELSEKMKQDVVNTQHIITQMLHHVLYLCSEEPEVTNHNPYSANKTPYGPPKCSPFVTQWDVGVRIGSVIRKAVMEISGGGTRESTGPRSRPRPHVRKPHWHHFWTGPKKEEQTLIVRWMHPIFVNAEDETKLPVVIHQVKEEKK